ncbi:MAG: two-component system, sensor histidine kinase and response regulator [Chloroflexota bacterium]|jgi:HPt (histidine-containing phosphotransfer) domain-containing protein|nr:two-component system, sensor histidine kinase and response regulator [Chloroflexota bacterium]
MGTPDADAIDPTAFANLLEMTGGDIEFVDELVDTYLGDGVSQLATMRDAAAGGDLDALTRAAHSLKSGSMNVGAIRLGELCRSLEEAGRSGTVDEPARLVAVIAAAFDDAATALVAERAVRAPG